MTLDTELRPFTEINSNWTIDLKVKCKAIKLIEDNTGENLDGLGFDDDFLYTTPKIQSKKKGLISWISLK